LAIVARQAAVQNHRAEFVADEFGQRGRVTVDRKIDPAHDIAAVFRLRIQPGANRENVRRSQVEQLRGNRCRAQIDGNAKTVLRSESNL
jgi:hypothetical protein